MVLAGLDLERIRVDVILLEPACRRERGQRGTGPCAMLRRANYTMLSGSGIVDHVWVRHGVDLLGGRQAVPFRCRQDTVACRGWDYEGEGRDYDGVRR